MAPKLQKIAKARRLSTEPRHALNAVCPYYTMFPLEYPLSILRRYAGQSLSILDPFCGRGTSIYAARIKGHEAFGIDSSPIATAIARAKAANCTAAEVLELAQSLLTDNTPTDLPKGPFWKWAFAPKTFPTVAALRQGLQGRRSQAADVLRAVCLGALHGPLTKDPANSSYFSNQMPRTFSTKPDYSIRYWKQNNLVPREVKVLEVIRKRVERLALDRHFSSPSQARIRTADARWPTSYASFPKDIDLCISSPPYYGMRTYVSDQWLRNWFIGSVPEVPYHEDRQVSHLSPEAFSKSLAQVWNCVGNRLTADGRMFIRFGSIPSRKQDSKALMLRSLELSDLTWKVVRVRRANSANQGKRQAAQMGQRVKSAPVEEHDFEIMLS